MVAYNNISVYGSVQFWVLIQILEACIYLEETISVLCVFNLADTAFFQPLYNQPSDTAVYHENKRRYVEFISD